MKSFLMRRRPIQYWKARTIVLAAMGLEAFVFYLMWLLVQIRTVAFGPPPRFP